MKPKTVAWLLVAICALGVALRLVPLLKFAVWGSDEGEYIFLTTRLVESGRISFAYTGWGIAYPYFPALFAMTGEVAVLGGLDPATALAFTMPVVAGVVLPLGLALVAWRIWGDVRAGLVSGAFAAVTAPQVIFSSHAMPATLGACLAVVLLVFLLESVREDDSVDRRFVALLVPAGLALVLAHHLSTYFAVGIIAGAAFFRELGANRTRWARVRIEVPLVLGLVALAACWWLVVATPFRTQIVGEAFDLNPLVTALAFVAALLLLPALVLAKRRTTGARWRPRVYSFPSVLVLWAGFVAVFLAASVYFVLVGVPGSDIRVDWITLLYLVPVVLMLGFALVGAGEVKLAREGWFAWGWMAAILVSLAFAIATNNRVIFPFRHIDILVDALAVLAGVGALAVLDAWRRRWAGASVTFALALTLVLAANAITSNPPRTTIGGFEEGISADEYAAVVWARDHLPAGETIAADHRVSSLLFGVAHLHASWDYTPQVYHAESWPPAAAELSAVDIPDMPHARLDYVFLSPEIRAGVILDQWHNAAPMSDAAWEKFFDPTHFEEVCGGGVGDCANGVYIFRVNWEGRT